MKQKPKLRFNNLAFRPSLAKYWQGLKSLLSLINLSCVEAFILLRNGLAKTTAALTTKKLNTAIYTRHIIALLVMILCISNAQAQWADFKVNVRVDKTNYIGDDEEVCNAVYDILDPGDSYYCTELDNFGWRSNIRWNENGVNYGRIRSEDATGEIGENSQYDPYIGWANRPVLLGNAVNDEPLHTGDAKIFKSNPIQKNSQYSIFPFFFFEDDGTYSSSLAFISGASAAAQGSYKIFLTQNKPTANTNFVEVIDELNSCTTGSCNDWYDTKFQVAWQYVPPADNNKILRPNCYNEGVVNQSSDPSALTTPCFPSWAVYLESGRNYKFTTPNSNLNTVLRLYDTNGYSVLATSNVDNALVSISQQRGEITCSVPVSGLYYLEMAGATISNTRLPIAPSSIFTIRIEDLTPLVSFPDRFYCSQNDLISPEGSIQMAATSGCLTSIALVEEQMLYNFPKIGNRVYGSLNFLNNYSLANESYIIANVPELVAGGIIQNTNGTLSTQPWMDYVNNLPPAVYAQQMALNAAHYQYKWIDHTNFDDVIGLGPICSIPQGAEYHEFYLMVSYDNGICLAQTPIWSKPVVTQNITVCDPYTWPANGQIYTASGNYTNSDKISFFNIPAIYQTAVSAASYLSTPAETFESYSVGNLGSIAGNSFGTGLPTWTATTSSGGLKIQNINNIYNSSDNILCTNLNFPLTISFTSGVTSIGGNFFSLNAQNNLANSTIVVTLSNGTTQSFTTNSLLNYFYGGFVSHDAYISSITISSQTGRPAVNDLVASTGTITPCVNCINAALNLTNGTRQVTETIVACESYAWHGTTYTSSNSTATWTGITAGGCDSIVTLNLTISYPYHVTETLNVCDGLVWNGQGFNSSNNTATWTGVSVAGCDSTVTLNLTINRFSVSVTEYVTSCGPYTWHGYTYETSNPNGQIPIWVGTTTAGCDSIVSLALTIVEPTGNVTSAYSAGTYYWPVSNQAYATSGTYSIPAMSKYFYTDKNNFEAAIPASGYTASAIETFDTRGAGNFYGNVTGSFGTGMPTYTAVSPDGFRFDITNGNMALQASNRAAPITISFSTPVTAFGANIFATNYAAGSHFVQQAVVTIATDDGNNQTIFTNSADNFAGFVSHGSYIQSITISSNWFQNAPFITIDNMMIATGTTNQCSQQVLDLFIGDFIETTETITSCGPYQWNGNTYTSSNNTATWLGVSSSGLLDSLVTLNLTINEPITTAPTITAGGTTTFCEGGNVVLTSSIESEYLWSNGATTQSITVSTAGDYSVLVTNVNGCTAVSLATEVTVNALPSVPTITAGGVTTFCAGGSVTLSGNNGATWSSGGTQASISVTTSGTYSVTTTNSCGSTTSNSIEVTVTPITVNTTTIAACDSYTWPVNGQTYTTSGTHTGNSDATVFYNSLGGLTFADASAGYTLSATETFESLLEGPTSNLTGNFGPGTPTWQASAPAGLYPFVLDGSMTLSTNAGGEPLTISFSPGVTSVGANFFITNDALNIVSGTITLTLSDGSTEFFEVNSANGFGGFVSYNAYIMSITIATSNNFVTMDNLVVSTGTIIPSCVSEVLNLTIHPLPAATISASGATTFCNGGNVILTSSAATGNVWSNGATTQAITVSTAGVYGVTVTDGNNCTAASLATVVSVNPLPTATISANGPTTFCDGGAVILSTTIQQYASSVLNFSTEYSTSDWSANQALGAPDVYPAYGDFINAWAGSNPDGNGREYLELGFTNPAPIDFIDVFETNAPGAVDTVYVKNPTTGLFEIVYTATAAAAPAVARILHITFPETSFNVSEIRIALNSGAVLDYNEIDAVSIGIANPNTYLWSNGETTDAIIASTAGDYSLTVTNVNGCSATSTPTSVVVIHYQLRQQFLPMAQLLFVMVKT